MARNPLPSVSLVLRRLRERIGAGVGFGGGTSGFRSAKEIARRHKVSTTLRSRAGFRSEPLFRARQDVSQCGHIRRQKDLHRPL